MTILLSKHTIGDFILSGLRKLCQEDEEEQKAWKEFCIQVREKNKERRESSPGIHYPKRKTMNQNEAVWEFIEPAGISAPKIQSLLHLTKAQVRRGFLLYYEAKKMIRAGESIAVTALVCRVSEEKIRELKINIEKGVIKA